MVVDSSQVVEGVLWLVFLSPQPGLIGNIHIGHLRRTTSHLLLLVSSNHLAVSYFPAIVICFLEDSATMADESPAQRSARLRRERREAKIKEGGSARLDKITSLSGRTPQAGKNQKLYPMI